MMFLIEEAAIAQLLFRASDLNHDSRLSFMEFATIAVLLSAARCDILLPSRSAIYRRLRTSKIPYDASGHRRLTAI